MALRLLFKMVKQLFNNKGYTLLESILVLFISGIMMIILSTNIKYNDCESVNQIINDIVILQFEAIIENDERYYESIENFKKYFQEERIKVLLKNLKIYMGINMITVKLI